MPLSEVENRLCLRARELIRQDHLPGVAPTQRWGGYTMAVPDRIVIDPAILHGKPVIRGTRVAVAIVLGSLAGGMTFAEIQLEYDITDEDIRAALKYAAGLVQHTV